MAFNRKHLITRQPVLTSKAEVEFFCLSMVESSHDVLMPFMLKLTNIDEPEIGYFIPTTWVDDAVLLVKLAPGTVLTTSASMLGRGIADIAKQRGFRLAATLRPTDPRQPGSDFTLVPFRDRYIEDGGAEEELLELHVPGTVDQHAPAPSKTADAPANTIRNRILAGVNTRADLGLVKDDEANAYFMGDFFQDCPIAEKGKLVVQPAHAVILEMMAAVQNEADPKVLDEIAKKDVTLSFKLLRFVNSASFGLSRRVESVRQAATILGYDQLLKWLSLLAITAGSGASPALTLTAMTRAKLMELLGKHMDRKEQDNLFITGMFSMLDRIMGISLEQVLSHINLPGNVTDALLNGEGKYRRFLDLAMTCEGMVLPEDETFSDLDIKNVNAAHLDAIEWAAKLAKAGNG